MARSRRDALVSLLIAPLAAAAQDQSERRLQLPNPPEEDTKLPNGTSQKDAIAKRQHEDALKDVDSLLAVAGELRDELRRAGNYVVPVTSVKKTEEIEKLAKRIRGHLKS